MVASVAAPVVAAVAVAAEPLLVAVPLAVGVPALLAGAVAVGLWETHVEAAA